MGEWPKGRVYSELGTCPDVKDNAEHRGGPRLEGVIRPVPSFRHRGFFWRK